MNFGNVRPTSLIVVQMDDGHPTLTRVLRGRTKMDLGVAVPVGGGPSQYISTITTLVDASYEMSPMGAVPPPMLQFRFA